VRVRPAFGQFHNHLGPWPGSPSRAQWHAGLPHLRHVCDTAPGVNPDASDSLDTISWRRASSHDRRSLPVNSIANS
jgi:hypothetical protein